MRAWIIIITTIFLLLLLVTANSDPQINCSKTCVAQDCNSVGIRYGKFCGVGWTGCPGQKPCDDLDACCKIHDECVEKKVENESFLICLQPYNRKLAALVQASY
ncbi:hypothetical protein MKX01_037944 [Papaver californicum]|nr:hypothetical protein MKX01_037944 [Papaver californicum]